MTTFNFEDPLDYEYQLNPYYFELHLDSEFNRKSERIRLLELIADYTRDVSEHKLQYTDILTKFHHLLCDIDPDLLPQETRGANNPLENKDVNDYHLPDIFVIPISDRNTISPKDTRITKDEDDPLTNHIHYRDILFNHITPFGAPIGYDLAELNPLDTRTY